MRRARALLQVAFAGAALALGPAACAALVGADFDSEHLRTTPLDAGIKPGDAAPIIAADGGSCPKGLTDCNDLCVDPTNDPNHCGRCATACPSDPHGPAVCVASACSYACESEWLRCAAGCCAVPDAGPGTDSGPMDPRIICGSDFCSVAAQDYCCGGSSSGDICVPPTSSANCPWQITCDNAAECGAGMICCYDDSQNVNKSMCQSGCNGPNQLQFCAASAECLGGTRCNGTFSAAGLQTTYSYCQ